MQGEEIWKLFHEEHQARPRRQQPVDPNLWPLRALIGLYRVSSTRAYPRGACRLSNTSLWPRYTKPKTSFVDLIVFFRGLSWGSRLYSWTHVDPLYSLLASLTEMFQQYQCFDGFQPPGEDQRSKFVFFFTIILLIRRILRPSKHQKSCSKKG